MQTSMVTRVPNLTLRPALTLTLKLKLRQKQRPMLRLQQTLMRSSKPRHKNRGIEKGGAQERAGWLTLKTPALLGVTEQSVIRGTRTE